MSAEVSVVSGLAMRIVQEGCTARPLLSGPAVATGLAAKLHGLAPRLLVAVPFDATSEDLAVLRAVDPALSLARRLPLPALRLEVPRVVGDGFGRIVGNPMSWTAPAPREVRVDRLIMANADPNWHLATLERSAAGFVAVDVHQEWLRPRLDAIRALIQRADLVTVNACDVDALGLSLDGSPQAERARPRLVVVKRGSRGVTLHRGNLYRDMQPPLVDSVGTDVCAGDVLLGALSSLIPLGATPTLDLLCAAYERSCPTVGSLLRQPSVQAFIEGTRHALSR